MPLSVNDPTKLYEGSHWLYLKTKLIIFLLSSTFYELDTEKCAQHEYLNSVIYTVQNMDSGIALGTLFGEYLYKYCLYKEIINLAGSFSEL